jgi:hypothetical protein
MTRTVVAVLWLATLAVPASADIVHLKAGGVIEGSVTETDAEVIVRMPAGEVRLPREAVLRVEKKLSVLDEFANRAGALQHDNAAGHYALGLWARQNGLDAQARALLQTTIAIDANHAAAREALGYRLVDGKWLSEADEMRAKGLILHDGQWMTPDAAAKLRTLEAQLAIAKEQRRLAEANLDNARRQPAPVVVGENPYDRYYANQAATRTRVIYPYTSYYSGYGTPYTSRYSRTSPYYGGGYYGGSTYGYRSTYRYPSSVGRATAYRSPCCWANVNSGPCPFG